MNAVDLHHRYSVQELTEMAQRIRADPANQQSGSLYLYTPQARKKLDAIGWAITWHISDRRSENE